MWRHARGGSANRPGRRFTLSIGKFCRLLEYLDEHFPRQLARLRVLMPARDRERSSRLRASVGSGSFRMSASPDCMHISELLDPLALDHRLKSYKRRCHTSGSSGQSSGCMSVVGSAGVWRSTSKSHCVWIWESPAFRKLRERMGHPPYFSALLFRSAPQRLKPADFISAWIAAVNRCATRKAVHFALPHLVWILAS